MPRPRLTDALLSADEVRDLIQRAGAVLEDVSLGDLYDGDEDESGDADARLTIGLEAYRFALRNAQALGNPALLDAVLATLDIHEEILWDGEGVLFEIFPEVLASLISKLRGPEPLIDELIAHPRTEVRAAVAEGLRPRTRWARAHLSTLAHDFWPSVRGPAMRTLRTKREVPDWWGRFDRDPLEGLSRAAAAAAQPHLEALAPLFDGSDWGLLEAVRSGQVAAVLERLPVPLGAALGEKVVRAGLELYGKPCGLFPLILRGAEAAGFLERWLTDWKDREDFTVPLGDELAHALRDLPAALGEPLRQHLVAGLQHPPQPLFAELGFRSRAAQLLAESWPPAANPAPLLDLILGQPEPKEDSHFSHHLGRVLQRAPALPDPLLERILQAQQAGWPERWADIRAQLEPVLEKLPAARLRPLAEKAARHPDDRVASWALHQLLTRMHDPQRDGPRLAAVAAAWKDPRGRRLLIAQHPQLAVPLLRRELRQGQLDLEEATRLFTVLHSFYGEIGAPPLHLRVSAEHAARFHTANRKPFRDLLGPADLKGPISDAEWQGFRALRSAGLEKLFARSPEQAALALQYTPPGAEWDPADREAFWRGVKLCWASKDDHLCLALLTLMRLKPLREDMLILEKLHRIDGEGWGLGHSLRGEIRAALGLDQDLEEDEPDEEPSRAPSGPHP